MKRYIINSWIAFAVAVLMSVIVSAMAESGARFGSDPLSALLVAWAVAFLAWANAMIAAIFAWRRRIFPRAWVLGVVFGPLLTLMAIGIVLRAVEYAVEFYEHSRFYIANEIDEWQMQKKFEAEEQRALELQPLQAAYEGVENNTASVGQFLDVAQDIIAKTAHPKEHGFAFASLFTKLTIKYVKARNYADAGAVVRTYIDKIYPRTGMDEHEKSKDFASNALVFAVATKNEELAKTILSELLGKRYDISTEKNEILAYNLACYYALHHDKEKMLAAVRRAVELGKKKQQFIADADFKDYLADKDFLAVFNP